MRRTGWILLPAVLLVTACSSTVTGAPRPDEAVSVERMFQLADKAIDSLDDRGRFTAYHYVQLGDLKKGTEARVSILGDNPEFVEVRQSKLDPSMKVTQYHAPKADIDMLKLDGKFAPLAPTPWVSYPDVLPVADPAQMRHPREARRTKRTSPSCRSPKRSR